MDVARLGGRDSGRRSASRIARLAAPRTHVEWGMYKLKKITASKLSVYSTRARQRAWSRFSSDTVLARLWKADLLRWLQVVTARLYTSGSSQLLQACMDRALCTRYEDEVRPGGWALRCGPPGQT